MYYLLPNFKTTVNSGLTIKRNLPQAAPAASDPEPSPGTTRWMPSIPVYLFRPVDRQIKTAILRADTDKLINIALKTDEPSLAIRAYGAVGLLGKAEDAKKLMDLLKSAKFDDMASPQKMIPLQSREGCHSEIEKAVASVIIRNDSCVSDLLSDYLADPSPRMLLSLVKIIGMSKSINDVPVLEQILNTALLKCPAPLLKDSESFVLITKTIEALGECGGYRDVKSLKVDLPNDSDLIKTAGLAYHKMKMKNPGRNMLKTEALRDYNSDSSRPHEKLGALFILKTLADPDEYRPILEKARKDLSCGELSSYELFIPLMAVILLDNEAKTVYSNLGRDVLRF